MFLNSKLAISNIVSIILLLIVSSVLGIIVFNWATIFQSSYDSKNELSGNVGGIEVLSLETNGSNESKLFLKNKGGSYHIVDTVFVNQSRCLILDGNVVEVVDVVRLNCSVTIFEPYRVDVQTDKGAFSNTVTVFE